MNDLDFLLLNLDRLCEQYIAIEDELWNCQTRDQFPGLLAIKSEIFLSYTRIWETILQLTEEDDHDVTHVG